MSSEKYSSSSSEALLSVVVDFLLSHSQRVSSSLESSSSEVEEFLLGWVTHPWTTTVCLGLWEGGVSREEGLLSYQEISLSS